MKKSIDIHRRYRKPSRFKSVMVLNLAIGIALSISQINLIAIQPPIPEYANPKSGKYDKRKAILKQVLGMGLFEAKAMRDDRLRMFKAIGKYGKGKFNFRLQKEQYESALKELEQTAS